MAELSKTDGVIGPTWDLTCQMCSDFVPAARFNLNMNSLKETLRTNRKLLFLRKPNKAS